MTNLDSREYIQSSNTMVLDIISDEFEYIKSTYIKKAYETLQDIVTDNIRTQANFMFSFIENNVDLVLKDIFKNAFERIQDDLGSMTNITCYQLDAAQDIEQVNQVINNYKDLIENKATYRVDLDSIAYNYSSTLNRFLMAKFDSMMSRQAEEAIDEISRQSKSYLERMVEDIYKEIDQLITRMNMRQNDAIKHYVAEFKKSFAKTNPNNKYEEDFTHDTFLYNGQTIVYQYEGKDYNCYVDGVKITDPNKIMEINRQLQEEFPEAQLATDSMVNHVSSMLIDLKQQEQEKGSERIEDILGTGTRSTEETIIPDWLKQQAASTQKSDNLDNITLDDYLKEEDKMEITPEKQEEVDETMGSLEMGYRKPETTERKQSLEAGSGWAQPYELKSEYIVDDKKEKSNTSITDDLKQASDSWKELMRLFDNIDERVPVRETTPEEKQKIADMTASLEIKDEPEDKYDKMRREMRMLSGIGPIKKSISDDKQKIADMTASLEIKDDPEPVRETTPEEKQRIADMTAALEIKDDEPVYNAREAGRLTEEELRDLLGGLEIKDDPEPVRETSPEEKQRIADMTAALEIKDEEPVKTEVNDDDVGSIQARMDELMRNPAVMEYIELQEKMRVYYNQYVESVEESMAPVQQTEQPEIMPDVILR